MLKMQFLPKILKKICFLLNSICFFYNFTLNEFFIKTSKDKSKNLATPGKPMSHYDFTFLIKEAEEAEFMTDKEFHKKFEEWRLQRKK